MTNVENQKKKLEQKKNKLAAEETKLKLKERKNRTRHLIELGGLIVKAKMDHLPINALYGALILLKNEYDTNPDIKETWIKKGHQIFDEEQKSSTAIILSFEQQPSQEIRKQIRSLGLRWNKFRSEWYGHVTDLVALKNELQNTEHQIDFLK